MQTNTLDASTANIASALEQRFEVRYPVLENATYKSLVNYGTDLKTPIQRWYRYKEGYSIGLMESIFMKYGVKSDDLILDPFCGSGSTLLQAKTRGFRSAGFEINPFSSFLAKVKTQHYSSRDKSNYIKLKKDVLSRASSIPTRRLTKPKLSTIDKLYDSKVLRYLLSIKFLIDDIKDSKARDLILLSWMSILEEASNYRKAGNGLKIRKGKNLVSRDINNAQSLFVSRLQDIEADLNYAIQISSHSFEPRIHETSSLNMDALISPKSVKGVVFSPPYANCFDYTEIYKVELWMSGFVKEYPDLKELRGRSIRSHLNGYHNIVKNDSCRIQELDDLICQLKSVDLWDQRIPFMVQAYFMDMFDILEKIYCSLEDRGFCAIVVSNSAYGGVVVPTDLLLAQYAKKLGFHSISLDVARFIITSSQQYHQTESQRKYLRESIVYLEK